MERQRTYTRTHVLQARVWPYGWIDCCLANSEEDAEAQRVAFQLRRTHDGCPLRVVPIAEARHKYDDHKGAKP